MRNTVIEQICIFGRPLFLVARGMSGTFGSSTILNPIFNDTEYKILYRT